MIINQKPEERLDDLQIKGIRYCRIRDASVSGWMRCSYLHLQM